MANQYLDRKFNKLPEDFGLTAGTRVHLIGVGGVAMASLAGLLSEAGCQVTGSDLDVYSPTKEILESIDLIPLKGYGPETLAQGADLVVVGNVVRADFPVIKELKRLKIPYLSLPQTLEKFFLNQSLNFVVAGCHGKTGLTNLMALLFKKGHLPSGRFIGGDSLDFSKPWGAPPPGGLMAIEGDEYDCAFFEKKPKFLHYRPSVTVLTSVDYDHADIYPNHQALKRAYKKLMAAMPPQGLVIHNGDDPEVAKMAAKAPCQTLSYGLKPDCDILVSDLKTHGLSIKFTLSGPGLTRAAKQAATLRGQAAGQKPPKAPKTTKASKGSKAPIIEPITITLPKPGVHNALNTAAAVACFLAGGGDPAKVPGILADLKGVRRRQEALIHREGITLIDDFAHHPKAVACTLTALRAGYPGRRILAAFEPRSNTSRRAVFQNDYVKSLRLANVVFLSAVNNPEKAPPGDRLDVHKLAKEVGQCLVFDEAETLGEALLGEIKSGDMIVVMSNGDFGGLAKSLQNRLELYLEEGRFSDSWLCACACLAQAPLLPLKPRTLLAPDQVAGYKFNNPDLLRVALTHRSILGAKPGQSKDSPEADKVLPAKYQAGHQAPFQIDLEKDNQRLEFLGDAVLDLIVAELLFMSESRKNEGDMTRSRSCLVCEARLAEVARGLDLGFRLIMAPGEQYSGGRERPSVLADAMEAVLGAIYLDGGYQKAFELVEKLWEAYVDESFTKIEDHKSKLQEFTQKLKLGQPKYSMLSVTGPSHNQTFTMSVGILNLKASASGSTKKMAGQRAARELYRLLVERYPENDKQ
ncbi:MAG: ribonuclease III [Deltaproteobacteria bacterium]|nr:ribonuclease III [Deltaproteobacteria bacterium]